MEFEPTTVPERLPALPADVRLLPGVDAEMPGEGSRVAETLEAHRAGVRPLSGVDAQVGLQVFQAVELSAAHGTAEGAAARGVQLQPSSRTPRYGWQTALLEPLAALAVVSPQQAGQGEGLTAELARGNGGNAAVCFDVESVDLRKNL